MSNSKSAMANIDYQTLLSKEAIRRKWSPREVDVWEQWRDGVGEVESNNIPDRTQGDSPKGIGRGKYQYETTKGSGTNNTAKNRLQSFLKRYGYTLKDLSSQDYKELMKKDPDFSKLSEDTQDMLFLADKAEAPETSLNDLVKGNIGFDDAWINWHWKGNPKDAEAKRRMWNRNVGTMVPEEELFGDLKKIFGSFF